MGLCIWQQCIWQQCIWQQCIRHVILGFRREVDENLGLLGYYLHTLVAGLLARSQYPEGPVTGHFGTAFFWFPCVYRRMMRLFPRLQVATACFSCSPPDLNFLDPYFVFVYVHNNHSHRATAHLQLNLLLLLLLLLRSE